MYVMLACCCIVMEALYYTQALLSFPCAHCYDLEMLCVFRRAKGPKGKGKSTYLERLRSGSYESLPIPPPAGRVPSRMMSSPAGLEYVPMTANSNQQQSDLDLTTLSERRGSSTSIVPP